MDLLKIGEFGAKASGSCSTLYRAARRAMQRCKRGQITGRMRRAASQRKMLRRLAIRNHEPPVHHPAQKPYGPRDVRRMGAVLAPGSVANRAVEDERAQRLWAPGKRLERIIVEVIVAI